MVISLQDSLKTDREAAEAALSFCASAEKQLPCQTCIFSFKKHQRNTFLLQSKIDKPLKQREGDTKTIHDTGRQKKKNFFLNCDKMFQKKKKKFRRWLKCQDFLRATLVFTTSKNSSSVEGKWVTAWKLSGKPFHRAILSSSQIRHGLIISHSSVSSSIKMLGGKQRERDRRPPQNTNTPS